MQQRAARYDPDTVRFLTRDPLEPFTRSAYGYVHNDPINRIDPSGLIDLPGWSDVRDAWDATGGKVVTWADKNKALAASAVSV